MWVPDIPLEALRPPVIQTWIRAISRGGARAGCRLPGNQSSLEGGREPQSRPAARSARLGPARAPSCAPQAGPQLDAQHSLDHGGLRGPPSAPLTGTAGPSVACSYTGRGCGRHTDRGQKNPELIVSAENTENTQEPPPRRLPRGAYLRKPVGGVPSPRVRLLSKPLGGPQPRGLPERGKEAA